MSTNDSTFISVEYDGEKFPNSSQHALAGYHPESIFLSHEDAKSPRESLHINQALREPEDLQDFFVKLREKPKLIFRYQNRQVSRRRQRIKRINEDIDEFRTAPAYSFGEAEIKIEPGKKLIERIDTIDEVLREYGINEIGLCCDWEKFVTVEELESELKNPRMYMRADVQGVASVEYFWDEDKAEINLYSKELTINNMASYAGNSPMDMRRNKSNETFTYIRDENAVESIEEELNNNFENVETKVLPDHVLPEDVRREI